VEQAGQCGTGLDCTEEIAAPVLTFGVETKPTLTDLVDEIFLGLGPVLLGDGVPAFPAKFPQRNFKLIECKSYSNGSVGLRYERIRTKTSR